MLERSLGNGGRAEARQKDVHVVGLIPARHDLVQLLQIVGNGVEDDELLGLFDDTVRGRIVPDLLNFCSQRLVDRIRLDVHVGDLDFLHRHALLDPVGVVQFVSESIDIGVGEVEGVLVSGVDEVESGVDDVGVDDGLVVLLLPLGEPEHVQDLHLLTEGGLARLARSEHEEGGLLGHLLLFVPEHLVDVLRPLLLLLRRQRLHPSLFW